METNKIPEPFFWNDEFVRYFDEDFANRILSFENVDSVDELPDDFSLKCEGTSLEPIFELSADWITERIDEERFSEDDEYEVKKITELLKTFIDFDKINACVPKVFYENPRIKFNITKKDLKDVKKN